MCGALPKREYAGRVAEAYLLWLEREGCHQTIMSSERLAEAAERFFAPEMGITLPPMRSLLAALKRLPGVRVFPNCRIYDADKQFVRKATVYTLSGTWDPDCDPPLLRKMRSCGYVRTAAVVHLRKSKQVA